jgi:hypothetical protein
MTQQNLDERLLELMPPLPAFVPPAHLCDMGGLLGLRQRQARRPWLKAQRRRHLIVSGGETDVCVLAS